MKEKGHQFDPLSTVSIIDKESRWFERGVREAIYERQQTPAMNKKGGLRFNLSHTWDRALASSSGHTSMNSDAVITAGSITSDHSTEEGLMDETRNICNKN